MKNIVEKQYLIVAQTKYTQMFEKIHYKYFIILS